MVWRFAQEPDVEFAYPHMQLVEPGKVQRQE
jgi:hypothetical protein